MATVVLLRGVNVGGHRTFRPSELAKQLSDYDVVNIGAAGTFVVRRRVTYARLRAELVRRLPFEAEIVLCQGRDILELVDGEHFANQPSGSDLVRFVSVLARSPRTVPSLPRRFPARGPWLLKLLTRDRRFVVGMYRRQMKAISYLGEVDRLFGVPATTRNWNTIRLIADVLEQR